MVSEITTSNQKFLATKEYRRFTEFCDACKRDKYIGLCYGPPGVGKTLSANAYSNWDEVEQLSEQHSTQWMGDDKFVAPVKVRTYDCVFVTAPVINGARLVQQLVDRARLQLCSLIEGSYHVDGRDDMMEDDRYSNLIIVDEADRLKLQALEELRSIFDKSKVGIILIGMPGMQKKLSRYPQLYSRVGFVHEFRALSQDELMFLVEQHLIKHLNIQDFTTKRLFQPWFELLKATSGS